MLDCSKNDTVVMRGWWECSSVVASIPVTNLTPALLVDSDTLNVIVDLRGGDTGLTLIQVIRRAQSASAVECPAGNASQHP